MTQTATDTTGKKTPDMFREASETFRTTMETGIKFQQDAFKAMTDFFTRGESFEDARKRMESVATDSIGVIRKNAEQAQRLFDEGCKSGMDVLRKALEETNGHGPKDLFTRTRDVWQSAFDAMRSNLEAAARTNTQAIECWSDFLGKVGTAGEKKAK